MCQYIGQQLWKNHSLEVCQGNKFHIKANDMGVFLFELNPKTGSILGFLHNTRIQNLSDCPTVKSSRSFLVLI